MTQAVYWIWLQEALGAGSRKADRVLDIPGGAKTFYEMDEAALRQTGFLTPEEIARVKTASLEHAQRILDRAVRLKCEVVTPDHPDYPLPLTHIHCKPCVLYVLGTLSETYPLSFTMVGTRRSTEYGLRAAQTLARDLAAAGCQVVSGLAVGIDQAVHEGALSVHGRTIGFLACGMDVDYPGGSGSLKRKILDEGGALATEFPFGAPPNAKHFPIRNRLMSGISDGTVVVQAPARSGALITARHAVDQDRDLFAVPGEIFDASMAGCNRLLHDGCNIAVNAYSILETYFGRFSPDEISHMTERVEQVSGVTICADRHTQPLPKRRPAAKPEPSREPLTDAALSARGLSEPARRVYAALQQTPLDCDAIAARTELPIASVVAALTELELTDLAVAEPGRRYRR